MDSPRLRFQRPTAGRPTSLADPTVTWFLETSANKIGELPISTTKTATTTTIIASPNPSLPGAPVTLTATVTTAGTGTPTGTVTFTIDGANQPPVTLSTVKGNDQATFTTSSLAPGIHVITATYSGSTTFAPSTSNIVNQVVINPALDGPIVLSLERFGFHAHPTTLVLTFDKSLDPTAPGFAELPPGEC